MTSPIVSEFNTYLFDCDGVLLDSNKVKSAAFFSVALPFGEEYARQLVAYHVAHGGVSRYEKLKYFVSEILRSQPSHALLERLLSQYGACVQSRLLECAVAEGLDNLRRTTSRSTWMVISGGDEAELRSVLAARGLTHLFDGGIFGSPASKDEILMRELGRGSIRKPAVFLGDSKYDYEAASRVGASFIFMSDWSEFTDWRLHQSSHGYPSLRNLNELAQLMATQDTAKEHPARHG